MLNLLVITGIIVWGTVTVSRLTRRLWPVRRAIPPLMHAELTFGGASLLLLAAPGPARLARDAVTGCLSAAITCGLLAVGTTAWRRYRNRMPVVRRVRSRIAASHVYIWVDAMCAVVAALAPPLVVPPPGSLAGAIGAVTGAGVAGLVTGISQSVIALMPNTAWGEPGRRCGAPGRRSGARRSWPGLKPKGAEMASITVRATAACFTHPPNLRSTEDRG